MLEWLAAPIDPNRAHDIDIAVSWHGRTMVLAWGVIAPLAVLAARFLKVLPWQDWPRERDSRFWWRCHWIGQSLVLALMVVGVLLLQGTVNAPGWHGRLGYAVLLLTILQVGLGVVRGSKGGPTAPARDGSRRGDHYDMTRRRRLFEFWHKSLGYAVLALALAVLLLGFWSANAPRWMAATLGVWWAALLAMSVILQRRGWAVDTYQAIWGPGREHPGNRRPPQGWGMRRPTIREERDVWRG